MAMNGMSQELQHGNNTFYFHVYPGVEETQGVPFVLLKDIQVFFPGASKLMCGSHAISYMCDANYKWLIPLRFAYRPSMIIKITETESSMSPEGMSQESSSESTPLSRTSHNLSATSPRQLTRQNTILQSVSVEPVAKEKFRQSAALYEDYVKAIKEGQKEQADLIRHDFQQCFSALEESMDRNHDLQQQMNEMQQRILQMQQQALDRLAGIHRRVAALLTQTYELHEYSLPRLFIVLPNEASTWGPARILNDQFRLYFLCECGEHTKVLNSDNTDIPHHIHRAKHDGYDLHRPKEFFQKYGRYMLTLLEMIKYGVTIAGFAAPGAIDMFKNSLDTISQSAVNQSIKYLQQFATNDSRDHGSTKDDEANSFSEQDALEGADLRQLEAFIKGKDEHRILGNLYRIVTQEGHVKWVCIDHCRLAYKEKEQQAFTDVIEVNGGSYDPQLGQVIISLQSKIRATEFFDALAKARLVDDLDISFDWECSRSDIEAFENALKISRVSILRLDLRRLRAGLSSKLVPTSSRCEPLVRIMENMNIKMIHIALPKEFIKLSSLQPSRPSRLHKLSLKLQTNGGNRLGILAEILQTNTTLTALDLGRNSIEDKGAVMLSEALKVNSTLITLDLENNSIGDNGALALSEALKTNSTLATLKLGNNSVGYHGILALSEVLKTNSNFTLDLGGNLIMLAAALSLSEALKTISTQAILDLENNSIRDSGVLALSEALKANSTLTTLNLENNSIGDSGVVALSEALKANTTLTTLNLNENSIGDNGAVALSEALKTNSTLATLNLESNSIGNNGAVALSEAFKANSALITLNLGFTPFGNNAVVELSEALKTNSTLTTLNLRYNSIGDNGAVALSEVLKASKCHIKF